MMKQELDAYGKMVVEECKKFDEKSKTKGSIITFNSRHR